ncbi:MAG: ABC transporter substrate-binding protein [Candidatus Nomurabacteria bacterium]|nr:ABC transporter substrate-binding protein [Candidatus Nomurabacteria bacterium]
MFAILMIVGTLGLITNLRRVYSTNVPAPGGTLTEGIIGTPRFINPVFALTQSDKDLTSVIFSGLLRQTESQTPKPDLAENYTISDDGTLYTFTLRDDVYFHDGNKIQADDVLFTIEKIQDPLVASPHQIDWRGVRTDIVDSRTIQFTLTEPYAGFLTNITLGILPKHVWESIPPEEMSLSAYNTHPIGSGAYRVKSIKTNKKGLAGRYSLRKFRKYYEPALIQNLIIKFFATESSAIRALERGKIDSLGGVNTKQTKNRLVTVTTPLPRTIGIFVGAETSSPLSSKSMRSAVNQAINKSIVIEQALGGFGQIAIDVSPLISPKENTDLTIPLRSDIEQYLDSAGWVMTESVFREKDGQTLSFNLATSNTQEFTSVAENIKAQLQTFGFDVTIQIFEPGTLEQDIIRARNFDALLFGTAIEHDTDIFAFWHSSERNDPGLNITGYVNPRVDTALEKAIRENNPVIRDELYETVSSELQKDLPMIPLYHPTYRYVIHRKIKNVSTDGMITASDRWNTLPTWHRHSTWVWKIFTKEQNI